MPIIFLQGGLSSAHLPFLFAAFVVSWAAFFVYAFFITRRQQEMRREIDDLRRALEEQEPTDQD